MRYEEMATERWENEGGHTLTKHAIARFVRAFQSRLETDPLGEVSVPAVALYGVQTQRALDNFRDLQEIRKAGVRLMPGTDVAVLLIYPGYSLHDELQLLVKYVGLTPMEAIISATRYPAEFFGMQNRLGTIEKGKIAYLVSLDANPLDDISNTKRIAAVVLNGRYLSKESREKMLADVEYAANRGAGGADKPGKGRKYGSAN